MKRKLHSSLGLVCVLLLLTGLILPAAAQEVPQAVHEIPDLNKTGTMTVTFNLPTTLSSYGTLTMTYVGQIHEDNGDYSFVPLETLEGYGLSFEDLDSPSMAEATAKVAEELGLVGVTQPISCVADVPQVTFRNLMLGVYLVTQAEPAEGYYALLPFLVSVPTYSEEEGYSYEIVAASKSEPEPEPTEPSEPSEPTEPTKPTEPSKPTDPSNPTVPTKPDLPQTGQLKWPVPVLSLAGVGCILLGCVIKRQREEDECLDYE